MNLWEINRKQSQDLLIEILMLFNAFSFFTLLFVKNKFSYFTFLDLNKTANRNCKDKCISRVV